MLEYLGTRLADLKGFAIFKFLRLLIPDFACATVSYNIGTYQVTTCIVQHNQK